MKQGHHSVVCRLDLKGCDAELAVISGRARHVALARRLIAQHGDEPQQWLPWFMDAIAAATAP